MNEVVRTHVNAFRKEFQRGIDGIVKAAEIYVASIDENPRNSDVFRDELVDWIPASAWSQFEAVGRKWIHPRLLMGGMSSTKKNTIVKRLPYSLQERVFERERFDLLTNDGDVLKIDVLEATPEQVEQLFDSNTIRTVSAQKSYIESRKPAKVDAVVMPYTINGGVVTFRRHTKLNKKELKSILQDM